MRNRLLSTIVWRYWLGQHVKLVRLVLKLPLKLDSRHVKLVKLAKEKKNKYT